MLDTVKDFVGTVGTTSGRYARQLGCSTSALARRVGPRRGAIALGMLAAAGIGIPLLVRYLRSRKAVAEEREPETMRPMNVAPFPETAPFGPALA